jgi:hypothetical protein
VRETEPVKAATAEADASAPRRNGIALTSVCLAAVAVAAVFFPFGAIPAAILAAAGLVVGIVCLVRDPGFNLLALIGTVASSAAVSAAVIMAFVRAIGA